MPRDWNINISVGGGDARGAFKGGRVSTTKSTLNTRKIKEDGDSITSSNLKRIFTVGFAFNKAQQANEIIGAYTNNRLRQRRVDTGMTFAKYSIGLAVNPAIGAVYGLGDLGYRGIMYGIKIQKQNREADYYKRLSGNNANSGSRYRGDYS